MTYRAVTASERKQARAAAKQAFDELFAWLADQPRPRRHLSFDDYRMVAGDWARLRPICIMVDKNYRRFFGALSHERSTEHQLMEILEAIRA